MNAQGETIRDIYTLRLRLRLPRTEDAMALAALMAPEVSARLASWPADLAPAAAAARLAEARTAALTGQALPLVVERRSDGALVGWISASRAEADPSRAVLTYWLGMPFQGQGVMREAAPAALAAMFEHLNVSEVRAAVQTDNLASRSVLRGIGMHLVGPGRIWCSARAREEDCEWWSVLRAAAPARQAPVMTMMPNATNGPVTMQWAAQ